MGQIPAALMFLALAIGNPWVACSLFVLAVLFEPKMLPSMVVIGVLNFATWWQPAMVWVLVGGAPIAILIMNDHRVWHWLWEAVYTIPKRMNAERKKHNAYPWAPWFTSRALMAFMPWVIAAVFARPDWKFWAPAVVYILFASLGFVIRPHHLIPLIPWVAAAGIDPVWAIALSAVDFVSAGFYFGDVWLRFYGDWIQDIRSAKVIGEWLKDKPGSLWVNGMHTEVYTYSGKPVQYGLAEQIEIAQVAHERREKMAEAFQASPPEWVVETPGPRVKFIPQGYAEVQTQGIANVRILKRK